MYINQGTKHKENCYSSNISKNDILFCFSNNAYLKINGMYFHKLIETRSGLFSKVTERQKEGGRETWNRDRTDNYFFTAEKFMRRTIYFRRETLFLKNEKGK